MKIKSAQYIGGNIVHKFVGGRLRAAGQILGTQGSLRKVLHQTSKLSRLSDLVSTTRTLRCCTGPQPAARPSGPAQPCGVHEGRDSPTAPLNQVELNPSPKRHFQPTLKYLLNFKFLNDGPPPSFPQLTLPVLG